VKPPLNIDFPLHFDSLGHTATVDEDAHLRDMVEQVLFTNYGERVNRPDLGGGALALVFAPNSPQLAAGMQFGLKASLLRWLGDVIEVQDLDVTSEDSTLRIEVSYRVRRTGEVLSDTFTRESGS
jgi:phage baseplate assembly protein W